jgi:hypothetical protein
VTDGAAPLHLRVVDAVGVPLLLPVGAAEATLSVTFVERKDDQTLVTLASGAPRTLKVDLYISPDGERWSYTSSCPIRPKLSVYENWPYAIPFMALANPRWLADGDSTACE